MAHGRLTIVVLALLGLSVANTPNAENGAAAYEWRHWGADKSNSHYTAADQINRENVSKLQRVWSWKSDEADKPTGQISRSYKSTPLYVGGTLYTITGLNILVALDPATGKRLWSFDPKAYEQPRGGHGISARGVEYWSDGANERIILATSGLQLFSIDAKTGKPDPNFGEEGGWTDLSKNLGRPYARNGIGLNSPAIVCRDTIVVGSVVGDFGTTKDMPPGHVRGYDVRTGKMKWRFNTIPQEGEFGNETWEDGSWKYSGNTNVWSMMSADEELGYVYLPTGTPTNDHYGGHRLGDNLFAESIVCLDAETGKRIWHFQAVHHGIWDYDFPCAPNLIDITVDGKKIKALAAVSKQGFTYVFDRTTGEPVWPIEERPVPPSKIPGERAAPTQPFPTKPPPFESQGVTEDDLIDFTPELRAEALEIFKQYETGPLFTPPIIAGQDGKKGLIQNPGMAGGANWPGAGHDPETGILYVQSVTWPGLMALAETDPARSDMRYNRGVRGGSRIAGPRGLPLLKPPYGRITAIDLNKGEIAWQIPHGDGPRNHPAIKHLNLPPLGSHIYSGLAGNGTLVTKTLLFCNQVIREEAEAELDERGRDVGRSRETGVMRAYDKATGKAIWENPIDSAPISPIASYMHQGKQYLAFTVGGRGNEMELVAYALP